MSITYRNDYCIMLFNEFYRLNTRHSWDLLLTMNEADCTLRIKLLSGILMSVYAFYVWMSC